MMTILSWILLALIVAVDIALFFSRTAYFTECKKVNVNALKTGNNEAYTCGSKFLSRQITYILDSKSKGININPGSVISDMTKYVWGFRHFCTYSLCILLVVYAIFVFLGMITENLCIILCSVSAVWYLICVLFDKASLSSETGMAEDVLRSVIKKYALIPKSYEQQKEELLVSVNSKLDSKINKNHEYAEISGTLSKTMQSVQGSIKSIFELTKGYCDLKTAPENSTLGEEIHVLESKVEKIEIQYKDMIKNKHVHDEDIQKYIEFFKDYNGFYSSMEKLDSELVKLFDTVKTGNISADAQLSEIKALLRAITAKQLNEVKMIVDNYISDVFNRISFLMENNLERTNQTLASNERLIEQGKSMVSAMESYNATLRESIASSVLFNKKIYDMTDANTQLVNFVLKRHKYIDSNVFSKLGKLVTNSPMAATDGELDAIKIKIGQLKQSIDALAKK